MKKRITHYEQALNIFKTNGVLNLLPQGEKTFKTETYKEMRREWVAMVSSGHYTPFEQIAENKAQKLRTDCILRYGRTASLLLV